MPKKTGNVGNMTRGILTMALSLGGCVDGHAVVGVGIDEQYVATDGRSQWFPRFRVCHAFASDRDTGFGLGDQIHATLTGDADVAHVLVMNLSTSPATAIVGRDVLAEEATGNVLETYDANVAGRSFRVELLLGACFTDV
jgi:hypothetical protein